MSALEKFSLDPAPARHVLRALPAQTAGDAPKSGPFDTLIRLADRLLPSALFVLDRGRGHEGILTWPPGVMGRRAAIDPLARLLLSQCPDGAELWIPELATAPLFEGLQPVLEAGPLGFARLPLSDEGGGASFAVIRERGEWSEEERDTLRDLAAAVEAECERQRLSERRMRHAEAAEAVVGEQPRGAPAPEHLRDRIGAVGPLLSGVCHELNNPLTSIKSFAELLLLDVRTEEDREALEIVQREAHRASRIVSDLRMIVRRGADGSDRRDLVDMNEVVRSVLRARAHELSVARVEVLEELDRDVPQIRAARPQMEQVVSHLVSNAVKAVEGREGTRRITITTRRSGVRVSLAISDSGRGIPAEHLDRIFDPFWTSRPSGEGSGLGLSLVQSIVADHGGQVIAESRPSQGSRFTVEIPGADELGAEALSGDEPVARQGLRVLVVDDEAPIRYSLARYLERRGHKVEQAGDGAAALRMLGTKEEEPRYDIIVADLSMPGVDGDGLLESLRARGDGLENRLILMTGDAHSPSAARHLQEAGIPVMWKPFELAEAAQVIEAQARLIPT